MDKTVTERQKIMEEGSANFIAKKQQTDKTNDQYMNIMDLIEQRENKVQSAAENTQVNEIKLS